LHALLKILRVHRVSVLVIAIVGVKLRVHATKLSVMRLHLLLKPSIRWLQVRHSLAHLHIGHVRRTMRTRSAVLHMRRVRVHRLALILMRHTTTTLAIHGSETVLTGCELLLLAIVLVVVVWSSGSSSTLRHIIEVSSSWLSIRHRGSAHIGVGSLR